MLKCKISVDRIFFPKNTEYVAANSFAIFSARVISIIAGEYSSNLIKVKGKVNKAIKRGTSLVVSLNLTDTHPVYGNTYEIVGVESSADFNDVDDQKAFLSTIVSENTADEIIKAIPNIIEILSRNDVNALKKVKGIGDIKAVKLIEKYNEIKDYEKAISALSSFGLSNNIISRIVDYYGDNEIAVNAVLSNPYNLTKINGVGFRTADIIARKINLPDYKSKRIDGFVYYTLETEGEKGKSYLQYRELLQKIKKSVETITEDELAAHLDALEAQKEIIRIGDSNKICLMKYYNMENRIAAELKRLYDNCRVIINDNSIVDSVIKQIEHERNIELTEKQKAAIMLSARYGVVAVTGLAGTGKTTSAYGICLLHKNKKILSIALSGKASVRISEITGIEPSTIHKALGYGNGKYQYNKNNPLDVDVVIVDESTMINGDLFLALLEAIPTGAKIIMYGDVQQLTPIGNCNVFSDILKSNAFPCVRLTEPHRQALKGGIIPVSLQIANQQQLFNMNYSGTRVYGEPGDMEITIFKTPEKMMDCIADTFKREYKKNPNILEVQILTPTKTHGSISCYSINNVVQNIYNPGHEDEFFEVTIEDKKSGEKKYRIKTGDKVINTKNNYNTYNIDGVKTPIFNGNIGIVTSIEASSCIVDFVGIGKVVIEEETAKNLELAYAISVHKSQGSGFDNVIVAIDNSSYVLNNVELLYTAITRAKKFCSLIAINKAIRFAIKTKETSVKQTLLKDFLVKNGGALYL